MPRRITDAILWVPSAAALQRRVGGMTIIERHLFLLAEAGARRVWVGATRPRDADRLRLPPTLEVQWLGKDADPPVDLRFPYLALGAGWLLRGRVLQAILAQPPARHTSWRAGGEGESVLQVVPSRGERILRYDQARLPPEACVPVVTAGETAAALPWLLDGVRKSGDGFMARHFDRRLSMAVTRRLLETRVTPNDMTVLSSLIGLAGAALLAFPGDGRSAAGALLVWLHTVLDGCDGELARLKFQTSRFGGILDFWGDNLVHLALFACLALGLWKLDRRALHLWLGAAACAGTLGSASLAFLHSLRRRGAATCDRAPLFDGLAFHETSEPGAARTLAAIEDTLAQRDFIYLLVVAAALGQESVFLWAGAIGAPLFFAVMLYLLARHSIRRAGTLPATPDRLAAAAAPTPIGGTRP